MIGASILLLLSCGVILTQGTLFGHWGLGSNKNSNSNTNSFRRNYNANTNFNALNSDRLRFQVYNDEAADAELKTPLEQIQSKLIADGNGKVATAVTAAAEATLSITRLLGEQMSATASIAIAEAIARILTDRTFNWIPRFGRRNANYNSNVNTNYMGHGRATIRKIDDQNQDDLSESENSLNSESSGSGPILEPQFAPWSGVAQNSGSRQYDLPLEIAIGSGAMSNYLRDNEDDEDLENTTLPDLVLPDGVVEQDGDIAPAKAIGSRGWNRRNSLSQRRSSGYRSNVNSNVNSNTNTFRRNLNYNTNANSNVNTFRRNNSNSNANVNSFNRRNRYRRGSK